jgi:hypothetical protein
VPDRDEYTGQKVAASKPAENPVRDMQALSAELIAVVAADGSWQA